MEKIGKSRKDLWHNSRAESLLSEDIKNGYHLQMKPKDLYKTRTEYQVFPLHKFRNHIYQIKDKE